LFASIPLLTLFVTLGVLRWEARRAALLSLVVSIVIATGVYSMPLRQALAGAAEGAEFPAADLLLVSVALGQLAALPVVVWAIAGDSALATGERVLLYFTAAFWFGQVAHPAAHELIHRPRRDLFRLGAAVYVSLLFGQHASAHRLVHHRHVASAADPNTARRGEGYCRFAVRAWIGSFVQGYRAESELRARGAGEGPHPYLFYLAGSAAALILAFVIAGIPGLLVWLFLALHAQMANRLGRRWTTIDIQLFAMAPI
jgi:alkane 1-monooxygenase